MRHNFYMRGAAEIEGLIGLVFLALIIAGGLWLFGFNFGITNQGTVSYNDCRQTITLQSGSLQTYFHNFTCTDEKTKSGAIMDGQCVAVKYDGGLLSSGNSCDTAYVYQLPLSKTCEGNIKNGVSYPYLGYDDQCYTTPQGGEDAISSTDTSVTSNNTLPSVQASSTDTTTPTPTTSIPTISARLTHNTMFSGVSKPTISGTYSNTSDIEIVITSQGQPVPTEIGPNDPAPAGEVFSDAADHGGGVDLTPITSSTGTFSDTLWQELPNGTYNVGIYNTSTVYTSSGFQGYSTATLLTSGTLTIDAASY